MKMTIHHAGHFTRKETNALKNHFYHLGLSFAGKIYSKSFTPRGRPFPPAAPSSAPKLTLSPPGVFTHFSYNEKRDNYVIQLDLPELLWQEENLDFLYDYKGTMVTLPRVVALSMEKALALRKLFEKIIFLKQSALPANLLRAEFLVLTILEELMTVKEEEEKNTAIAPSLAVKLQRAIKEDIHFKYPISIHCRNLGYTPGYCRKVFTGEMGLDPGEYRMRCRMERILYLLSTGNFSYKEIAFEVGMKHVTHLHSFVKKRSNRTLEELSRQLYR